MVTCYSSNRKLIQTCWMVLILWVVHFWLQSTSFCPWSIPHLFLLQSWSLSFVTALVIVFSLDVCFLSAANCLIHFCVSAVSAGPSGEGDLGHWLSILSAKGGIFKWVRRIDHKESCLPFLTWWDLSGTLRWYQLKVKMGGDVGSALLSVSSLVLATSLPCSFPYSMGSWSLVWTVGLWVTESEWAGDSSEKELCQVLFLTWPDDWWETV